MTAPTKESWTRIGIVSAIACVVAGISFGLMHVMKPDFFAACWMVLGCFTLIGCVFAFAFARQSRDSYVAILALLVVFGAMFCAAAQGPCRYAICAAFSAVVHDVNYLPPDPEVSRAYRLVNKILPRVTSRASSSRKPTREDAPVK